MVPSEPERELLYDNTSIHSATIIQPEKCAVTIAGYKVPCYLLVLGVLLIVGVSIILALTLPKNDDKRVVYATNAPSDLSIPTFAPSISMLPTSSVREDIVSTSSSAYPKGSFISSSGRLGWIK